jgi:hypothetical protein
MCSPRIFFVLSEKYSYFTFQRELPASKKHKSWRKDFLVFQIKRSRGLNNRFLSARFAQSEYQQTFRTLFFPGSSKNDLNRQSGLRRKNKNGRKRESIGAELILV